MINSRYIEFLQIYKNSNFILNEFEKIRQEKKEYVSKIYSKFLKRLKIIFILFLICLFFSLQKNILFILPCSLLGISLPILIFPFFNYYINLKNENVDFSCKLKNELMNKLIKAFGNVEYKNRN